MKNSQVILTTLMVLLLVSCPSPTKQKITLNVWLDNSDRNSEFFTKIAERFAQQEPQIALKFKFMQFNELKPRFAGLSAKSSEPDVIWLMNDWIGELADKGLLLPLTAKPDVFVPISLAGLTYGHKLYAWPLSLQVIALVYNKQLVPKPPETIQEMIQIAQHLQEKQYYGLMYDNKNCYYHVPWFYGYGATFFDKQGQLALNSQAAAASFAFARDLEQSDRIIPPKSNYSAMLNLFNSGKVGMIITGPWSLSDIEKNHIPYGVVPLPILANGQRAKPFLGIKALGISRFSQHPTEAQKLLTFLTSLTIQKQATRELKELSALTQLNRPAFYPAERRGFMQQIQQSIPMPNHPTMKAIWQECNWALERVFNTSDPPEKILDQVNTKLKANGVTSPVP